MGPRPQARLGRKAILAPQDLPVTMLQCPDLTLPQKKFLRDGLIGLLRAGRPIVCAMARKLPDRRSKFLSRRDRMEANLNRPSDIDQKIKAALRGLWLPMVREDTPIILDVDGAGYFFLGVFFFLGLPRERRVVSRPQWRAIWRTQRSRPNGAPRRTQRRSPASSSSLCGRLTCRSQLVERANQSARQKAGAASASAHQRADDHG